MAQINLGTISSRSVSGNCGLTVSAVKGVTGRQMSMLIFASNKPPKTGLGPYYAFNVQLRYDWKECAHVCNTCACEILHVDENFV